MQLAKTAGLDGAAQRRKVHLVVESNEADNGDSRRASAIRFAVLALLTCQNCSLMMVASYSLSLPGPQYLASTAVVANEVVKTVVVFTALIYQHGPCATFSLLGKDVLSKYSSTARFAVPAFFYTVQNNLWYFAMDNLDSVTAAVTSQMKVISTALFSVMMLNKQLNGLHWMGLFLLMLGLTVMQMKQWSGSHHYVHADGDFKPPQSLSALALVQQGASTPPPDLASKEDAAQYYLGLSAMLAACASSGYAGVYLERLFKELDSSVWISNMQLQLFCLPIALLTMLSDWQVLQQDGVLSGWSYITCVVVALNSLGGFIVSLTMKYADNILKTFAVSMSLVANCFLSWLLLGGDIRVQDSIGVIVVISGTWLYSLGNNKTMSLAAVLPESPSNRRSQQPAPLPQSSDKSPG